MDLRSRRPRPPSSEFLFRISEFLKILILFFDLSLDDGYNFHEADIHLRRYTDSPDGNWLIGPFPRDPTLFLATSGSGHAFKVSIHSPWRRGDWTTLFGRQSVSARSFPRRRPAHIYIHSQQADCFPSFISVTVSPKRWSARRRFR